MLNAFRHLLCSKLCRHNRQVPKHCIYNPHIIYYYKWRTVRKLFTIIIIISQCTPLINYIVAIVLYFIFSCQLYSVMNVRQCECSICNQFSYFKICKSADLHATNQHLCCKGERNMTQKKTKVTPCCMLRSCCSWQKTQFRMKQYWAVKKSSL